MPRRVHGSVLRSIHTLFSVGSFGEMTDGQLLNRFLCRRDEEAEAAFAALVGIHGPMVWDVCRGVLADSHAAEDAFQATFLVLARRAGSIRRRDAVGPWLHGVARRVAVRAKDAAARRQLREGQTMQMTATPTPDPICREQIAALHEEVDRLAEKYRAPLVLCYFEGRTYADAAELLRCPVGTVSIRLVRARELLRARLTRRGLALPVAWVGVMLGSRTASAALPNRLAQATIKVAMKLAADKVMTAGLVPASIAQLVQGEIRTMIFMKLTAIAAGVVATGLVTTGVVLLAAGGQPAPLIQRVAAQAPLVQEVAAQAPLGQGASAPAQADGDDGEARGKSSRKLMELGLAMQNFAQDRGRYPAAAIRKDGKPLLSWRVALLPFLDEKALHDKFHLDEPWDSPHNKALLDEMPAIYAPVTGKKEESKHSTYYQVFAGPGALFGGDEGSRRKDIKDGAGLTIMIVEAAKPVPWTKPDDLSFDKEKPLPELGGLFKGGFHILCANGSVRFLDRTNKPEVLRALITPNGGEPISDDDLQPH
jgi:RNA polymerase sigma factor (sigma-70 family)